MSSFQETSRGPTATSSRVEPRGRSREYVAGIVLASGRSTRFGGENKLLAELDGRSVVRRTVDAYLAAALAPVIVVVGFEERRVAASLDGRGCRLVSNPDFEDGQSRALVRGVEALDPWAEAAIIGVGDQPLLTPDILRRLVDAWHETAAPLVGPRYAGQRANPVLFDRTLFGELLAVTGDVGGRPVVARHEPEAVWIDIDDSAPGMDVDTHADLSRAAGLL